VFCEQGSVGFSAIEIHKKENTIEGGEGEGVKGRVELCARIRDILKRLSMDMGDEGPTRWSGGSGDVAGCGEGDICSREFHGV
jgi:hypothetical protein